METKENKLLSRLSAPLLVLTTVIWGSSFIIMKDSVVALSPLWLLAIRFTASGLLLALIMLPRWRLLNRSYLLGGAVMGVFLWAGYTLQTFGLFYTTPGKNAFLTTVYCIIVPFLYWAVAKRRPDRYNIIAAVLCLTGVGLLSITGEDAASAFNIGDVLTLMGGFFFASHILAVEHFSRDKDIFLLTVLQFLTFALLSWLSLAVARPPLNLSVFEPALIGKLAYLVVFVSCGGLLFQNVAQKYTAPTKAAVLLSLEAPFGVLFSVLITHEIPEPSALLGFSLIFLAVVCSETKLSFLRHKKTAEGAS